MDTLYNTFIGVDPGMSGAIAVINPANIVIRTLPFFKNELDGPELHGWLEELTLAYPNESKPIAYVEKVGAMPGQGVVSMWNFGYATGQLHMIFKMLHIPYMLVTPQKWKGLVLAGSDKSKLAAINYCLRRYPDVNIRSTARSTTPNENMADALCIADYARQMEIHQWKGKVL